MLSTPVFGLGRGLLRLMRCCRAVMKKHYQSQYYGGGKGPLVQSVVLWWRHDVSLVHGAKEGKRRTAESLKIITLQTLVLLETFPPFKPKHTLAQIDWTDWIIKSVYWFFVFNSEKGILCNVIFFFLTVSKLFIFSITKLLIGPQVSCSEFFISSKIYFVSIHKWYGPVMQFHCTFAEYI